MGSAAPQPEMHGHRDLRVWRMGMALVTDIYEITARFPKHQVFALANQMQRAAYSIPCNIAEGHGRNSRREFHQSLGIARGSLLELETQIEIARNLGFISSEVASGLLTKTGDIGRMLSGLLSWTRSSDPGGQKH